MPHPVRDTQTTTTPPHQPSPPTPPPLETPPAVQRPPPAGSPPSWLPRRGPGRRAGRPVAQPTFAGWRAGPPPPARRSRLLSAAPNGWSAGSRAGVLLAALGCPSAPPRCPLPSCAQLTGGAWAAGGSSRRSRPPDRPGAGRAGRDLPVPDPCWCLWVTPASSAFLRLFWPFRCCFAPVQRRLSGLRVLWIDQAWSN